MSHTHYTQLTYDQRVLIEDWINDTDTNKRSLRAFAKHIGKSPSTISREVARNGRPPTTEKTRVNKPREDGRNFRGSKKAGQIIKRKCAYEKRLSSFRYRSRIHYTAKKAQKIADERVKRPGLKLEQPECEELLQFVITTLDSRWSPEQIAATVKFEGYYPPISANSIYDFIYAHEDELHLKHCLRRKGNKYRKQKKTDYNQTTGKKSIDDRPEEVDKLERIGDLEGDTIVGKDKTDRLVTHNDRLSGLVSIGLVLGFNAKKISEQTVIDIRRVFGTDDLNTTTYDNGPEFADWAKTERELNMDIYFAHPYRSCERGRNENTNGLIRDFLPKGTDFKNLTTSDILEIESLLNNRPRKRLGWLTPAEYYEQYIRNNDNKNENNDNNASIDDNEGVALEDEG